MPCPSSPALAGFVCLVLVACGGPPRTEPATAEVSAPTGPLLGSGEVAFEWLPGWFQFPEGLSLGNTHGGIAFDRAGQVYVNTDTERAILVFGPDGRYQRSFGSAFAGGLHGMVLVEEPDGEAIYAVHHAQHAILKLDLAGHLLWSRGAPLEAPGIYADPSQFHPTAIAVAPGGDLYVADGYGTSWLHRFRADGSYVASFGGPGVEPGLFQTCHGMSIDTSGATPELWIADRENHRLQVFDLEGRFLRVVEADLRRPCSVIRHGEQRVVADLAGRISLLDSRGALLAHLGENPDPAQWANNGVPPEQWRDGVFIAPHFAAFDGRGDLYVMDWVSAGRLTKLRRLAPGGSLGGPASAPPRRP
jgi:sugar lactone lactonase YvrE